VHSACALCKTSASWPRTCGVPQDRYSCADLARSGTTAKQTLSAPPWLTAPSLQQGSKPRVNPRWSLTPRSTPTRSGRQRKAGPRHMVHHRVPALRRLPTRAALPRTLGSTKTAAPALPPSAAMGRAFRSKSVACTGGSHRARVAAAHAAMPNPPASARTVPPPQHAPTSALQACATHRISTRIRPSKFGAGSLVAARLWSMVHSACALCRPLASWPRTCGLPQDRYSCADLPRSGTAAQQTLSALPWLTARSLR
jgi:hypothetical protein